jgi:hypothetical protein
VQSLHQLISALKADLHRQRKGKRELERERVNYERERERERDHMQAACIRRSYRENCVAEVAVHIAHMIRRRREMGRHSF